MQIDSSVQALIKTIQELSLARNLNTITEIVRHAARELTGADGATFILREGDRCYYVDEDSIGPLWKGQRFRMSHCVSGWVMLNRESAMIEDIEKDERVPMDAYRPTFVKSLLMVPIRRQSPIGAIGNYWATRHQATPYEIQLLEALADSTSIALENVQLYSELEQRVEARTRELQITNRELEAFSYSVSHDLRAPLRSIKGYSQVLQQDYKSQLDAQGQGYLNRIEVGVHRMEDLIEDILMLSKTTRQDIQISRVDLHAIAEGVIERLRESAPARAVHVKIGDDLIAYGDPHLLQVLLENLLGNAWKYTGHQAHPEIEINKKIESGKTVFFIRDNGVGFDMKYIDKLFTPFQRLHTVKEFEGTGIGLATAARIVSKQGGHIWAEADVGKGATFFFSLDS